MKTFNGKAIYNPSGAAGEYSYWACNFFVGCSNGCEYCYCKKGILKNVMGMDKPQLKKCFKDEYHAYEVFERELMANIGELREHGLFFSFTTDPLLDECLHLTWSAITVCLDSGVPVKILTKMAHWADSFLLFIETHSDYEKSEWKKLIAFGFTLTGHDELEPGASTNAERIEAMKKIHYNGFKTFASIEPIIDFESSMRMIQETLGSCDLYKVGLMSGKKYNFCKLLDFTNTLSMLYSKMYIKDSIKKVLCGNYTPHDNFVSRDYNIFKN